MSTKVIGVALLAGAIWWHFNAPLPPAKVEPTPAPIVKPAPKPLPAKPKPPR